MKNEVIELGFLDNGTGKHQSNTIYSIGGVMPTQCAAQSRIPPKIVIDYAPKLPIALTQTIPKDYP